MLILWQLLDPLGSGIWHSWSLSHSWNALVLVSRISDPPGSHPTSVAAPYLLCLFLFLSMTAECSQAPGSALHFVSVSTLSPHGLLQAHGFKYHSRAEVSQIHILSLDISPQLSLTACSASLPGCREIMSKTKLLVFLPNCLLPLSFLSLSVMLYPSSFSDQKPWSHPTFSHGKPSRFYHFSVPSLLPLWCKLPPPPPRTITMSSSTGTRGIIEKY